MFKLFWTLVQWLRLFIDICCEIYAKVFWPDERFKVQPVDDDILLQPAVELANQIRSGKLRAEKVMRAYVNRMKQVNPIINAITDARYDEAIKEAQQLDAAIKNGTSNFDDQPLLGIPISSKDSVGIKGLKNTGGITAFRNRVQDDDAEVVKNLRKAGAIPVCMTNVPCALMWYTSENKVFGRTNNPYDLTRVPGGSSGGEGALIGAAASLVGIGSDIGGSIRIPAFSCGIFGHKTTSNVIPDKGKFPPISDGKKRYFTIGPMVRYAADLIPSLKAMAGDDIVKLPNIDNQVDLKGLKVYYLLDDMDPVKTRVNNQVQSSIVKLVDYLESKGAEVKTVQFYEFWKCNLIYFACLADGGGKKMSQVLAGSLDANANEEISTLKEFFREIFTRKTDFTTHVLFYSLLEKGFPKPGSNFSKNLLQQRDDLIAEFDKLLGGNGIFIMPSAPESAPKHGTTAFKVSNINYFSVFNILGMPVTQCPIGLDKKTGCPLGIQIAANPFQDHLTLNVAQHVEKLFGGWTPPYRV